MKRKSIVDRGSVRYVVFRDKDDGVWYAAALELNIVESGDDPQQALFGLFEAVSGYVASARKIKTRSGILRQKSDPEYEKMWHAVDEAKNQRGVPYHIFTTGRQSIPV